MAALLSVLVPTFGAEASAQVDVPTISADPSTGLADGQTVTVTVSGLAEGEQGIRQCATGASDLARCKSPFGVYPQDGGGGRTATVVVDTRVGAAPKAELRSWPRRR